jgi:prefoldin subunit 5
LLLIEGQKGGKVSNKDMTYQFLVREISLLSKQIGVMSAERERLEDVITELQDKNQRLMDANRALQAKNKLMLNDFELFVQAAETH